MQVIKSSGVSQEFDMQKIIKVLEWACEGTKVDPYELYEIIKSHLRDGMSTADIQKTIVKVAANSISIDEPDYQYVASNAAMFEIRKRVFMDSLSHLLLLTTFLVVLTQISMIKKS